MGNNMREIKFRAWNKKHSNPKERMMHSVYLANDARVVMPDGAELDIPVMQYTGLKDKNGKDIYEGDIIEKEYGKDNIVELEVKWDNYGGFNELYCSNEIEVIGNIYENPNLLK